MNENKLCVVAYLRVATASQINDEIMEGHSIGIRSYAENNGMQVVGEVRACEKGTAENRPGWSKALQLAAKENADGICVIKLNHVARGADALECFLADLERRHLQLITCAQDFADAKSLLDLRHRLFSKVAVNTQDS